MKKRVRAEALSPGNAIATLLDERNDALDIIQDATYKKLDAERMIMHKIMKDPVGFEDILKIDWTKLHKMFGV